MKLGELDISALVDQFTERAKDANARAVPGTASFPHEMTVASIFLGLAQSLIIARRNSND